MSGQLNVGAAAELKAYYYPPDEKPTFDYVVKVTPQPPADSGCVNFHQGSETGTVLDTKNDVSTSGTGRLTVDLSSRVASTDSPLFVEFVFTKDGHEDQSASRAIALADPAPAAISVDPATPKPGDQVALKVTDWNAIVYDTQGTGTAGSESDASRISTNDTGAVKWKVGGNDVSDQGAEISYTVPSDASADLDVEAFLDRTQAFPAKATIQLLKASFKLTLLDETGAPVDGIDIVFSQSGQTQTVTTGQDGNASYAPTASSTDPVTANFADLNALQQKMSPLWQTPRTSTVPDPLPQGATQVQLASDTTTVADTAVDASGATVYVTPAAVSVGIFFMQCFDGDGVNPLAGKNYTITSETDSSKQWTGSLDDQGTVRIESVPHGDYDMSVDGVSDPTPILVLDPSETDPQIRFLGPTTPPPADDSDSLASAHQVGSFVVTLNPTSGDELGGTVVTLVGQGVDKATSVTIGGVALTNTTAGNNSYTGTTGKHDPGRVDVVMTFPNNPNPVTLAGAYIYGTWYTIDPVTGPQTGGTSVRISMSADAPADMLSLDKVASVSIGGQPLRFMRHESDGTITGTTPGHGKAEAVAVFMMDATDIAKALSTVSLGNAFTYGAGPVCTDVTPASGPLAGGTNIQITVENLTSAQGVTFDGSTALPNFTQDASSGKLIIKGSTPATQFPGPSSISVQIDATNSFDTGKQFTYYATPVFTSISPPMGGILGDTYVTITGQNLKSVTSVEIGGKAIGEFQVGADGNSITGKSLAHDAAAVDVVLKGCPTGDVTASAAFTYGAAVALGVKSLTVPANIAPGADKSNIQYEISDAGGTLTDAKIELFQDGSTTAIWTRPLTQDERSNGQHTIPWDGKIDATSTSFPDGYITIEFSPYTLKLSVTGPTPNPDNLTAKVQVIVGSLTVALADKAVLTNDQDKVIYDQVGSIQANIVKKLYLESNVFIKSGGDVNGNVLYTSHHATWFPGPRIPLVAKLTVKRSDGYEVVSGKALGGARVVWKFHDGSDSSSSQLGTQPSSYIGTVGNYDGSTKPGGDNCHADFGGKRSRASTNPVFAAPDNGLQNFPFTCALGTVRTWEQFSTFVKTQGDPNEAMAGVVFRPSPCGGDDYDVTAVLDFAKNLQDVASPPAAAVTTSVGRFETWRVANLTKWIAKNAQVNYALPVIQTWYDPGFFNVKYDATTPTYMTQADYDSAFTAALSDSSITGDPRFPTYVKYGIPTGVSQWDLPALPNTWGNTANPPGTPLPTPTGTPTTWLATIYGYGDFKQNLATGQHLSAAALPAVLTNLRVGNENAYNTQMSFLMAMLGTVMAQNKFITDKGITVIQFLNASSMATQGVRIFGQAVPQTNNNAKGDKTGFLQFENDVPTMAHEIGHCLGLPHSPAHSAGLPAPGGAQPNRHDATDQNCLMSYNDPRTSYCGLCLLRLRGFDANKFNQNGSIHPSPA
jgi:hypothetical protein